MHPHHHAVSRRKEVGRRSIRLPADPRMVRRLEGTPARLEAQGLRHHSEGIFACEEVFGTTLTNSEGRVVPVRQVGEQHVTEDLGRIPTAADWLRSIKVQPWMLRRASPTTAPAAAEVSGAGPET